MNRRRVAIALMITGALLLLSGVFYLLEAANGPGAGPKTFAQRRSYNLVKRDLHAALPIGGALALGGLVIVLAGNRLRERASAERQAESE